ncbi:MAG: cytochrome P450 [Cyanobacteria bacterium P01_C01_bin.69]
MTEFPIIDTQQQLGNKIQKQSVKQLQKPKGLSLFRRLEWILDPVTYLERTQTQLPDFFEEDSLGFGVGPTVIASHPEAIQYILSRDRKLFKAPGEFNRILAPLIGDTSAIMLSGEQHKTRRRLMAPAFHGDRLEVYGQLICQLTHERVNALATGEAFAARDLTQQISLQTIAKVVLGFADGPNSQTMLDILTETADGFGSPVSAMLLFFNSLQKDLGAWSPWGRFLQLRRQLDELLYAEIDERLQTPDPSRTDILSMLMASRTEAGEALSKEELRDELMALLLAGHETTATAIAWSLYWVHRDTGVKEKLLVELDSLGPDALPGEIAQLPYLSAVCKETLRRSPVAMFTFPRVAQAPVDMLGYHFEAGSTFLGCIFLTHRRSDLYPNPRAFRPERFLERKYSPYEFVPFGNGARRCVGEALAQYEQKLAIATLLSHYRFRLADQKPEKSRRRGVTLAPARGVPMIFEGKR